MTRIADNRKARHDYFIEEEFEAGIVLEGWEVKSIRAGRVQIAESHIIIRDSELFVLNMHISPLETASTHIRPDATRSRKLLMHKREINKLIGRVEQRGYTLVPLNLYFKKGRIKMTLALAKGKKQHDKRETIKDRDWEREKARIMKNDTRY
ncbi:Small protein B [Oligella ureolytica]|uniref:SsrA-binding protein n=1 Tax=Oligella ureolytica TaxID=90244 RepID=A0A378XC52_9BURK|nr:SsrA-binding protein SmpB [Oligella ureolytica]QPT40174.1 SsrA-binding protein SmpB [Oligella ureolytica]SUA50329.1 Small protein B [Oligella ureolytica]SUA51432.1 Small protein B [Oligella ureolytica]